VNATLKRFLPSLITVAGIFAAAAVTIIITTRVAESTDRSTAFIALVTGAVAAGLSLPVLIWLSFRSPHLNRYSAYTLEELDLSQDDLTEAVGNWVYGRYRQRMENTPSFLEDEDGNVTCRVTVRKD
jgi:hypothetical protein